ncbi:hypothetical protein NM688_g116 [Phlebia brevispora]|uniref:Uncharacterized protein n=1 Tax=Phlebia brevispora TaxID=194682 RepID=A0ACC1TFA3_9APHY|nr:hypothetical protein NM688_g116 [Phlebia brevispora]
MMARSKRVASSSLKDVDHGTTKAGKCQRITNTTSQQFTHPTPQFDTLSPDSLPNLSEDSDFVVADTNGPEGNLCENEMEASNQITEQTNDAREQHKFQEADSADTAVTENKQLTSPMQNTSHASKSAEIGSVHSSQREQEHNIQPDSVEDKSSEYQQPPNDAQQVLITSQDREYFDQILMNRLQQLLTYKNENTRCYSVQELPDGRLTWPPSKRSTEDKSDLMHVNFKPAVIWLVGEIVLTRFAKAGYNARRPCILLKPLLNADADKANSILRTKSNPQRDTNDSEDGLWVGKWIARNSVPESKVPPFVDIFDATGKLKQKAFMKRLDAHELKRNDLVLVEAMILQWPLQRGEERQEFFRTRNWKNWRTELKLDAIYLLHSADEDGLEQRPGEDIDL